MFKSKKIVLMSCISAVLFLLIFFYIMAKILTAHVTKEFIVKQLETTTGYHVTIDGDLAWHITLHPNVSIQKIVFKSPEKIVIQLENANISVALLPLLQKRFAISLYFQQWQQNQLHFSNGTAYLTYEDNILNLSDFNADFYQGHIHGHALVNLKQTTPTFQMSLTTSQAEMAALLKDIANTVSVSGKMDMQADLKSSGNNANDFIHNLNGNINLTVKDGKLNTIHLSNIASSTSPNSDNQQIDFFSVLSIQNVVVRGIADSTIKLVAKNYNASGNGHINFNDQTLDVTLDTYYIQSQKTKDIAIPIHIYGNIASPNVSVNFATPMSKFLSTNKNQLIHKLHKFFG